MTSTIQLPQDKPPEWANSLMKWALTTPGLQTMIGQGLAVLTFTGRRSGLRYSIPVSYARENDLVTIVTKRQRKWWRNFETPAEVHLRLAGKEFTGKAEATTDETENLDFMTHFLAKRPIDAKAYGLGKNELTRDKIARITPHIVVIRIAVTPVE